MEMQIGVDVYGDADGHVDGLLLGGVRVSVHPWTRRGQLCAQALTDAIVRKAPCFSDGQRDLIDGSCAFVNTCDIVAVKSIFWSIEP